MDNPNDRKKAVLYCRIASSAPKDQKDLDIQEQKLRAYAEKQDYHVVRCLKEQANGLILDREQLSAVRDMNKNTVDKLLIADISRIGRNFAETNRFIENLFEKGIEVETPDGVFEDEPIPGLNELLEMMGEVL